MSEASGPLPSNDTRGPEIVGVLWALCTISWIIVLLRLYVRTFVRRNLGWDDYTIVAALCLATSGCVFETVGVHYGTGRHLVYVYKNLPHILQMTLYSSIENTLGTTLVKISVCIFILRMIQNTNKPIRWTIIGMQAILIPVTIATTIVFCVQCIPISGYWNPNVHAKCFNPNIVTIMTKVNNSVCVVTDFMTVAIPLFIIYKLQMSRSKKISVSIVLGLGLFSCGASIAKTYYLFWNPPDPTWSLSPVILWSGAEHMSGIIIASLPPLVHLFKSLGSKTIRTTRYTYGETAGGQSHAETLNGTSRPKFPSQKGYTRNLSDDTEFSMDDMTIKRETHVHVEIEPEHITAANKNADGAYIDGLGFHRRQD